jgi:hypothetical protein
MISFSWTDSEKSVTSISIHVSHWSLKGRGVIVRHPVKNESINALCVCYRDGQIIAESESEFIQVPFVGFCWEGKIWREALRRSVSQLTHQWLCIYWICFSNIFDWSVSQFQSFRRSARTWEPAKYSDCDFGVISFSRLSNFRYSQGFKIIKFPIFSSFPHHQVSGVIEFPIFSSYQDY